jgi:dTDP-4-dehydrorhamnose 3,5-epimerase
VPKRFEVLDSPLPGLKTLQRQPLRDARGYFERMFCSSDLAPLLGTETIVQINHTSTVKRGTLRGMHFQRAPHQEIKIVSCLRGAVFDVAVDIRAGSATFLHWHSEILSADNHRSLLVPKGFAHGFQTLTDDCELLYLHTAAFHAESEGGLHPLDQAVAVRWPEPVAELSARDSSHPHITQAFRGLPNEV